MNSVEAAPAAVGVAAPMVVPSEPVSIVVDEKLMVVLNKDGGVESMEVNGGMALQVLPLMLNFFCQKLCGTKLLEMLLCVVLAAGQSCFSAVWQTLSIKGRLNWICI